MGRVKYLFHMTPKMLKYLSPLLVYAAAFWSFNTTGWPVWAALLYAWVFIPVTELFLPANPGNMSSAEEELARSSKLYDYFLYIIVPLQYGLLAKFLISMQEADLSVADIIGRVWTMGLLCGTFGINVGHELGHRTNKTEQFLAKALLLTSLYMHFFIEHNRGHHKRVATPEDPSSARYGEVIYVFYFRSILNSYFSAWRIANNEQRKKNRRIISLSNEMIQYHLVQVGFVAIIFLLFNWLITFYFLAAAGIGILLLETVNYIEHYGLQRKSLGNGKYERALPAHSWNSDHVIGRLMLFELSRHSDHHYLASRKYQVLRHHDEAPQMPTGYPGMMLLALVPPAWFYVMNPRVRAQQQLAG